MNFPSSCSPLFSRKRDGIQKKWSNDYDIWLPFSEPSLHSWNCSLVLNIWGKLRLLTDSRRYFSIIVSKWSRPQFSAHQPLGTTVVSIHVLPGRMWHRWLKTGNRHVHHFRIMGAVVIQTFEFYIRFSSFLSMACECRILCHVNYLFAYWVWNRQLYSCSALSTSNCQNSTLLWLF